MIAFFLTVILYAVLGLAAVGLAIGLLGVFFKILLAAPFVTCILAGLFFIGLPIYLAFSVHFLLIFSAVVFWPLSSKMFRLIEKYQLAEIAGD